MKTGLSNHIHHEIYSFNDKLLNGVIYKKSSTLYLVSWLHMCHGEDADKEYAAEENAFFL